MKPDVEKRTDIRLEILMDAGFGTQVVGDILVQALTRAGLNVYVESIIPSEISPPKRTKQSLSGIIVRIADFELSSIGDGTDLILASHEVALESRLSDHEEKPHCRVLLDYADENANGESYRRIYDVAHGLGLRITPFEIGTDALNIVHALKGKGKNIFYLGMLSAVFNLPRELVANVAESYLREKLPEDILKQNLNLFELGHHMAEKNVPFSYLMRRDPKGKKDMLLIDGGQALSMGIIDAGFKLCTGYPITPAFYVMQVLAKEFPPYGGILHVAEDEIAAIGSAIGAYFGGLPAITCTSGPGLSLKQEFIGFATAAELPVVILNVQRAGPSTGMPTKTEQSDLLAMIFGSHGDNAKIVISVSDSVDCFYAPSLARYLADKLRLPVFIAADFQIMNSFKAVDRPQIGEMNDVEEIGDVVLKHFRIQRLPSRIEMVRPDQRLYGTPRVCRVTGLNTDEAGSVDCSPDANQRSHFIRNEKLRLVSQALEKPEMIGPEEGEVLLIGWGSSRGALTEAIHNCIREGFSVSGMHMKIVYPLPLGLNEIFSGFQYIATVEGAYGDTDKPAPFASLLRIHTGMKIISMVSAATGRPLRPGTIAGKTIEFITGGKSHGRTNA